MRAQNHEATLVNLAVLTNWRFSQPDQYVGSAPYLPNGSHSAIKYAALCGLPPLAAVQQPRGLRKIVNFDIAGISRNSSSQPRRQHSCTQTRTCSWIAPIWFATAANLRNTPAAKL